MQRNKAAILLITFFIIVVFVLLCLSFGKGNTVYSKMVDGLKYHVRVIVNKFSTAEENQDTAKIPVYSLWIKGKKLDILNANLPQSGRNYVDGEFEYKGSWHHIKARYRGDMPWHWGSLQKSWRIRFRKSDLFEGRRDLNLNNPEREVIDEALEFWLAKEMGLVAPECNIAHVRLNGYYLGVLLDIGNIDDYFLKNHNLQIGNIYSAEQGDMPYENYANVWKSTLYWVKRASNPNKSQNDTSDLSNFIRVINTMEGDEFQREIQKIIDVDKVLTYIAFVDIGASEHIGNVNNNRLYFSPSTGKMEQILWDTSGHWTDEGAELIYERKKSDFWLKLLDIPEFRQRKNEILWRYLEGVASTQSRVDFIERTYRLIRDDVYADKYKDTYLLLPMTNTDFEKRVKRLKEWVYKRNDFLSRIFNESVLYVYERPQAQDAKKILKKIEIISKNESGIFIQSIKIPLSIDAAPKNTFELWFDENRNGMLDESDALIAVSKGAIDFEVNRVLLTGIEITEPSHGYTRKDYVWIEQVPRVLPTSFTFFIVLRQDTNELVSPVVSLSEIKPQYITAKNAITAQRAEVIVSTSDYAELTDRDKVRINYIKGKIITINEDHS